MSDAITQLLDGTDLTVDTGSPILQGITPATLKSQERKQSEDGTTATLIFQWETEQLVGVAGETRQLPPGSKVFQRFNLKHTNEQTARIAAEQLAGTLRRLHGLKETKVKITNALIESAIGKRATLELGASKNGEWQDIKVRAL